MCHSFLDAICTVNAAVNIDKIYTYLAEHDEWPWYLKLSF